MNTQLIKAALQRTISGNVKGMLIDRHYVCSPPEFRGDLSEEEYAPYRAAADLKHEEYMRWGLTRMPAGALRNTVVVNDTVVAWLQYDGVPRVIERHFWDPFMNTVRDLAREHLGQDQEVQQRLADRRGDIENMTAKGFSFLIEVYTKRATEGSEFNDYPTDIPVRVFNAQKRDAARQATGLDFPSVPNPTRRLTDEERALWDKEADRYTYEFRARFPVEHRLWKFDQWWQSTHRRRANESALAPEVDDRIVFDDEGTLAPAVVETLLRSTDQSEGVRVDLLMLDTRSGRREASRMQGVVLWPGRALRYQHVPADLRQIWDCTWTHLEDLIRRQHN